MDLSSCCHSGLVLKTAALPQGGRFARSGKVIAQRRPEICRGHRAPANDGRRARESQPNSRDYAGALNNLAQLYGEVGRDADAEPI